MNYISRDNGIWSKDEWTTTTRPNPKSNPIPVFTNKALWKTAMSSHLFLAEATFALQWSHSTLGIHSVQAEWLLKTLWLTRVKYLYRYLYKYLFDSFRKILLNLKTSHRLLYVLVGWQVCEQATTEYSSSKTGIFWRSFFVSLINIHHFDFIKYDSEGWT